jgi:hypothetical protein
MTERRSAVERLTASALAVVALGIVLLVFVLPAAGRVLDAHRALDAARELERRYARLAAERPALEARLAAMGGGDSAAGLIGEREPGLAGAALQSHVQMLVDDSMLTLRRASNRAAGMEDGLGRITVTVDAAGDLGGVVELLASLEDESPAVRIDEWILSSTNDATAELELSFSVTGFFRAESEDAP